MSSREEILIQTVLAGEREFVAGATAEAGALGELTVATDATGAAMKRTTESSFAMRQGLFTLRRVIYAGTLAVIAAGVEAVRMGFNFDRGMQTARVAMRGFLPSTQAINDELNKLYNFAAYTPFQFQDIVLATRRLVPFVHGIGQANDLIYSLVNGLSAMGITTQGALNRGSIALAHMLSSGRVTGLALNQLTRDNIPLLSALAAHFHITTEEVRQLVKQGLIRATVGAQALNEYIRKTPGYAGAAMRLATQSLTGSWTTFKDIIMKSFGSAEGGLFSGLQHLLQGVDLALAPLLKAGKPITITDLVRAFDQQLSPSSRIVINLFETMLGIVQGLQFEFRALGNVITYLLYPLHLFGSGTGAAQMSARLFGYALSVVIFLFIGYKVGVGLATLATEAWTAATKVATAATAVYEFWVLRAEYAQLVLARGTKILTGVQVIAAAVTFQLQWWQLRASESALLMGVRMRAAAVMIVVWNAGVGLATLITGGFTVAVEALTAAIYAIPLIGWILLAITALVTLYFKWKAFHDAVNSTISFLYHNPLIAFFVPVLGPMIVMVRIIVELVNHFQELVMWAKEAAHWVAKATGGGGGGWMSGALGIGANILFPGSGLLPRFAGGGVMAQTGVALVGEKGPELALLPGGTRVVSNEQLQPVFPHPEAWRNNGTRQPVVLQLVVDGQVLAEAVTQINENTGARL